MVVNSKTMSRNVVDTYKCSGGSHCLHFQRFSTRHNNTRFEDKDKLFLQNFCIPLQDYMVSQTGRPKPEHSLTTMKT